MLEILYLMYPIEVFRSIIVGLQMLALIMTWANQKVSDFYVISHPLSWMNFSIIVSVAAYHTTTGQAAFLKFKSTREAELKDLYDEDIMIEWFLIINATCAFLLALVNFAILLRREVVHDEMPPFYVADIRGQQTAKNMNLAQLEEIQLRKMRQPVDGNTDRDN